MKKIALNFIFIFVLAGTSSIAQTVSPGKQTISKTEYYGLNLTTSIPEKHLSNYWEAYLNKFGKVKSRRGVYELQRSYIPSVANGPIDVTSTVSSSKNISTLFLALNVNGSFVTNNSDTSYAPSEQFLKTFLSYASGQEEVRIIEEDFAEAEKNNKKLIKEGDRLAKDIEKAEKELVKLKDELAKNKTDIDAATTFLQNKQKDVEAVKAKVPKL